MAKFNKGDRFQKLDDNDDDIEDDSDGVDFRGHEITPTYSTSTMVMSSTAAPTTATSNTTLEKTALLQTPPSKTSSSKSSSGKLPLNYTTMSSPETTATSMTTPRASPVSVSSNGSSSDGSSRSTSESHNNDDNDDSLERDSTIAMMGTGAGQRRSVMELDGIINHKKSDEDVVEIYEAEDSSTHYSETQDDKDVTKQAVTDANKNPFDDEEDKQEAIATNPFDDDEDVAEEKTTATTNPFSDGGDDDEDHPVNISRSSGPVDLDESISSSPILEEDDADDADDSSVKSLDAPSIQSQKTDDSEDVYKEDDKFAAAKSPLTPSPDRSADNSAKMSSNPSQVKSLVQSFNNKANSPLPPAPKRINSLKKPSIVGRAQSTPIIRPPPNKPRPIPVPVPTSTPTDSSLTDSYKNKNVGKNNDSSRRTARTVGSKHSKGGSHHDIDDDEETPIEIHGIDLLEERDHSVSELQEMSHLMTFNALILIQKQKDWLEGSSQKAKATSLMFELENMERKIKLLSDHREWPNETERQKQRRDPLTPSKAFFKAMSLLDRSIEQFHQGYLSFTATKSQENHELKRSMEQVQSKNSTLLTETQTAQHSLQHLENERNDLAKQVKQMEKHLSLVQIKQEEDFDDGASTAMTDVCANNGTFLSKVFNIKSYIESLEEQQRKHVEEIEQLKKKVVVEEDENGDNKDAAAAEDDAELQRAGSGDSGAMGDDLGSRWHTLEQNEVATEKAADLEQQVQALCVKLADREQDLTSLRAECKLIRMQLLQEERSRNEFKTQMAEKDSALSVAEQRIANLEEEVLKTHARCATYEEDYAALKDSYATQKEATLQELGSTQEETKAQMEKIQTEYEGKLTTLEQSLSTEKSERERLVRDLKTALEEMETERDQLKAKVSEKPAAFDGEEKKEADGEVSAADVEKMKKLEEELKQFERMRERLAEKACTQATAIATLTEANENKEAQLNSLQEMIEMLLQERDSQDNTTANQMKHRMSSLRDKMREKAAQVKEQVQDRSSHGGVFGSQHGLGSQHGP
ncbi:MAG: hypothetical protein SGILL_003215 [Bacillariaceae sp.]